MYSSGCYLPPLIPSAKAEAERDIVYLLLLDEVLLLYMSYIQVQTLASAVCLHCQGWGYNTVNDAYYPSSTPKDNNKPGSTPVASTADFSVKEN